MFVWSVVMVFFLQPDFFSDTFPLLDGCVFDFASRLPVLLMSLWATCIFTCPFFKFGVDTFVPQQTVFVFFPALLLCLTLSAPDARFRSFVVWR